MVEDFVCEAKNEVNATTPPPSVDESLCVGDCVYLLHDEKIVGEALVFNMSTDDKCHNVLIGLNNILVHVIKCYPNMVDLCLPFPHLGADTFGESVNSFIVWRASQI